MKVRFGADEFGLPTFVILLAEGFLLCKGYGGRDGGEGSTSAAAEAMADPPSARLPAGGQVGGFTYR